MTGHYKKYIIVLGIFLFLSLFFSCEKENTTGKAGRDAVLVINASIGKSSLSAETKGAYSDTTFTKDQTLGLSVCVHESGTPTQFEPYMRGYGNLKVTKTDNISNSWSYYNSEMKLNLNSLYLTSRADSSKADVYAYSPYMSTVTDLKNIDVDFSKNQDLMWATQNGIGNKGIDPTVNDSIPVTLNFQHVLSRIRFGLKLEYAGSDHLITYIALKKTGDKSTPIYSSGTFSAMAGTFSVLNAASDSVRINYSGYGEDSGRFFDASNYTYFDYLICPTDYLADDDLTVIFCIDGFRHEYPIKRSDVLHSDGTTYGFKKGYTYNFQFQFDNYIHLKGITIQSEWTAGNLSDPF